MSDMSAPEKSEHVKVRALLVDARVKEFTLGAPHEVTDRVFVVQRAFRINDSLPQESSAAPRWEWQRGGWILVDRLTGRVSPINLPDFDAFVSAVSWYRDYAAYCGISDDGKQMFGVVARINRRKPIVKWLMEETKDAAEPQPHHAVCKAPDWQRSPARVTFEGNADLKRSYAIRSHAADLIVEETEEEEAEK